MAEKTRRVLIFYTKVGGGHESLAIGLQERLLSHFGDTITIKLVDPFTSFVTPAYQLSTIVSPKFYNLFYRFTKGTLARKLITKVSHFIHEEKIRDILERTKPDLVLSTHFLFNSEVKEVIQKNSGRDIPVVVYVADPFSPHPVWFNRTTDLILSYDHEHLPNLQVLGINSDRIIPIGMPVRRVFYHTIDRWQIHKKLDLDPEQTTILFGGSGLGMDHLERLAKPLNDANLNVQMIFLCGKNALLERALKLLFNGRQNCRVFGYLPDREIAALMQSSDLFVGKAGPNIMFECILSNLPQIMTPPILAQERGNRRYIREKHMGYLSSSTKQTVQLVKRLVKNPQLIAASKNRVSSERDRIIAIEEQGNRALFHWITSTLHLSDFQHKPFTTR